jgi:hypothetical protein
LIISMFHSVPPVPREKWNARSKVKTFSFAPSKIQPWQYLH